MSKEFSKIIIAFMKHRIRAAAIIIHDERILLVKHVHPTTGFTWWVPPGGGVEFVDTSVIDCVVREVFEETGLHVRVSDDVRFVREFFDGINETLNIELFFDAHIVSGEITTENIVGNGTDEDYIKEVQWFRIEELHDVIIFPNELRENFGRDVKRVYRGRQDG